jgi:acyl transferase domain-containing protein/enoyl-CoA hydratase/carnithine racemase/acyl carrier protein
MPTAFLPKTAIHPGLDRAIVRIYSTDHMCAQMRDELRQIYTDLSNGKLSSKEALDKIKATKLRDQEQRSGVSLLMPVWQVSSVDACALPGRQEFKEHHVIVGGLSQVQMGELKSLLPHSRYALLPAEEDKNIAQRYSKCALACFEWIQAILQSKPQGKVLVQVALAGHQQNLFAGLSGLLKTAALENPQLTGQLILTPEISAGDLAVLLEKEKSGSLDAVIRYKSPVERQILCWQEAANNQEKRPVAFKEQGVYLITGGLGGLGLLFAKEIQAQTQQTRVVLTGRSTLTADKQARLKALSAMGGRVSYRRVDLANLNEVQQLITGITAEYGQLNGILHGAGMIADNFILKKSSAEFDEVLAPKVTGTYNLDEATKNIKLDFFVLFSSIASALGNAGQADYTTANGFMDQFAAYRNAQVAAQKRYGQTRAINWGFWQDGGMRTDAASIELLRQSTGMKAMQTSGGLEGFYHTVALPYDQMLVVEGDRERIQRVLANRPVQEIISLPHAVEESAVDLPAMNLDSHNLAEQTQDYLRKQCSQVLKLSFQKIDPQAALEDYGIDSILATRLTSELEKTFGPLSKTLFFEYQTISDLARYFIQSHSARLAALFVKTNHTNGPANSVEPQPVPAPDAPARMVPGRRFSRHHTAGSHSAMQTEPVAIIGLSGSYPEAINIDAYWRNLRDGKDCIVEVPKQRWDWREYFSEDRNKNGHHFSKWGGFIAGVDEFDPLFFNIAPKDARYIDPQERLFLQHAWMAIEDAGYTRASLQMPCDKDLSGQVGVYVGLMYSEYQLFGAEASLRGRRLGLSGSFANIANRVSYAFNLHGPSMTLDTMCSSSLTAIHIACQDLKQGRTSMALAGGVNVTIHPNKYLMLSAGQFISSDGHCQSFGEGGDGYIPGEGVGVVVLKRLSEAERDGDHIYGIIRGSALNHGGKTNGYTVPNPQAQASAISRALAEAHVDARHISYIEAHGTGTKLGDPIEITALSKAFQHYTQETGFCQIGSAKSNIGHCESAAGIAGLTKVLLQMQHRQIVPSLHSEQLNPNIDFPRTPFVVNQQLREWEQPVVDGRKLRRIAGISSFGAGGSNAHMIVEEYEAPVRVRLSLEKVVVVLSARTAEQLKQKASDLLDYVRERQSELDLAAVAYTLQVGREAMEERLGLVASSAQELVERLQAWLGGKQDLEDIYEGGVKRNRETLSLFSSDADLQQAVERWITQKKVNRLLELWVKGLEVNWSKLYGDNKPQRISLPTYPFAKERYWIDTASLEQVITKAAPDTAAVLHPLLHRNTSNLTEQRYSSTFSGQEFFLTDHLGEQKLLPGSVYLEMARAAIEEASPERPNAAHLELHDLVWTPAVLNQNSEVNITLLAHENGEVDFEIYSQDEERDMVYCQGHALWSFEATSSRLDVEQLKAQTQGGSNQVFVSLCVSQAVEQTWENYVLHPSLIESALHAAAGLIAGSCSHLFALERLSVLLPCSREISAWVRYAPGSETKLDIDLCDEHGNVCVQMSGVSWQAVEAAEAVIEEADVPAALVAAEKSISLPLGRNEIVLRMPTQIKTSSPIAQKKRAAITLAGSKSVYEKPEGSRSLINLSSARAQVPAEPVETTTTSSVRLFECGHGIFSVQVESAAGQPREIIAGILQALSRVRQERSLKVLMLSGIEHCFARSGREAYNEAVIQGLYEALVLFPCPAIAVLNGDTGGAALLAAALCDFMVCSEEALFSYTDVQKNFYASTAELQVFSSRFGAAQAQDLLYQSVAATGRQLRDQGWTCPIVAADQTGTRAEELAVVLAGKSQKALRLLKQHLTRDLTGLVKELRQIEIYAPDPLTPSVAELISPSEHIRLEVPAENVIVIQFGVGCLNLTSKDVVADLGRALVQVQQAGCAKAMVLASEYPGFLPDTESELSEDVIQDLQRTILESEIPVIAALAGNARGPAWLMSQFCDGCIYNLTGEYSPAAIGRDALLLPMAAAWFSHRMGEAAASEILLSGAVYSGSDLQKLAGTLLVAEQKQVLLAAIIMAEFWARLPQAVLADWKRHTATTLAEKIQSAAGANVDEGEERKQSQQSRETAPVPIPLQSKVVTVTAHAEGIVVVKMEDRQARNMFSDELVAGITEAFAHIEQTPSYKVVVLTGYDSYFSSGGSRENLLDVQAGKKKFTDFQIFRAALQCQLPVIAAMQGHGIGVGWAMGMFADVMLLSEESRYVSPYMNYGFTPGGGATCILAEKMGQDLARESLLTGQPYTGRELKRRGLRLAVLPGKEVYAAAIELARQIAQSSRSRLIRLKQQLSARVQQEIEETCRLELALHEQTLVGQSDALAKIQKSFEQKQASNTSASVDVTPAPALAVAPAAVKSADSSAENDLLSVVTASLRKVLANELQMQESDVDENAQFVDLGLDSISGVTWIRKINEKYGTSVEATKVYNYPTLGQLSRHVKAEAEKLGTLPKPPATAEEKNITAQPQVMVKAATPSRVVKNNAGAATKLTSWRKHKHARFTVNTSAVAATAPAHTQSIAVIGMAGQFPQAKNLEEFWQNIAQGKNCISRIPSDRWDVGAYYQPGEAVAGKSNSQWVGALEEYDCFDPLFFNISPTEAESMDPQQRLFLQACWHSIENAGYDARRLSGSRCGVFVGAATGDYHQISRQHQLSAQGFTGNATSILAARISYFLNLQGPCISTDTACSSSLVSIAQACDSLIAGSSDLALAGGVYVMAGPEMHIKASQAGMLSPEGKCFTFDQRADGFVPGEGVGVVVLKRLADAERDQDIIYGVIEGWGVNQDGKTNGITAPNPESQTRLEQEVYDGFGINPENIQLVEAHGTGTKLGDPIEVEGLKNAFAKYTGKREYCALGSVKSNIGHCATAAGVAGFLKLVLALQHKQLPPTINFERLNEHISLQESPFYVNSGLQEWERKGAEKRQGAISSFGFSGTNAHVVVGEYAAPAAVQLPVNVVRQNGKMVVPLSASTAAQLKQKARELRDYIHSQEQPIELIELAYTLQAGRQAMDERAGFLVGSVEELADRLSDYIEDKPEIKDFYQGQIKRNRESVGIISQDDEVKETIVNKWIAAGKLSRLLEFWVKGLELDWKKLYGEGKPPRIALPVYPFAKQRYWIPVTQAEHKPDFSDQSVSDQEVTTADSQSETLSSLIAVPVWQTGSTGTRQEYSEHHIILCELSGVKTREVESLLQPGQCLSLERREQSIAQRYSEYAWACFERIQSILQRKPQGKVLLQIVAANSQEQALFAGLSGLLKTAALENPQFTGHLVLTSAEITSKELAALLQEEKNAGADSVVRYQQGVRQVLHWEEVTANINNLPIAFKEHGVYLITGGLGGLGLLFAKEILTQTREAKVVLTGRSPLDAEKQALLKGFSEQAGRVTYRQLDLNNLQQVRQLIVETEAGHGQLKGILHAAGMIADNFILKKSSTEFSQVLAPKVTGTFNLDEASKDMRLDFFVLFSSIAGALGNVGQADYAAANSFMDQFAAYRNSQAVTGQRHGQTRSINWGLWQAGGMSVDPASMEWMQQATGMRPLQPATGMEAFHRSLAFPCDQVLVVEGVQPYIQAYLQRSRILKPSSPAAQSANPARKTAISLEQMQQHLKSTLAAVLRIDASMIDVERPFVEYGLDSFLGVEVVNAVNKKYGTGLSNIRLFDYPTIKEFSLYLEQEIRQLPADSVQAAASVAQPPTPINKPSPARTKATRVNSSATGNQADDKIAIIGMSGRYPGAKNLQEYWENLSSGRNSIVEVPPSRWDVDRYYNPDRTVRNKTYSKWLGALDDIDCFDPLFFRISPQEAEHIDPQHRLFLQESYRAFEDAGYSINTLSNKKCGVYLGISTNEYMLLLSRNGVLSPPVTGNSSAIAAARIAYYLNLKGPAISVDTACSSSLVAIHLAAQAIRSGEIDMALAGGVTLWLMPESYLAMSQAGMFSPSGQCKTFDDSADGIVNGEGVGAVVLKRLRDAERDNDFIYGVILGSGINQDGKTNGITAPSVKSQIELERSIYEKHKIHPESISYVETHGTGTKLGDPIELEALATVFNEKTTRKNFCALGAVKSNIGHTTSAAGVAGLHKVLLSLRHRTLAPTLNVKQENSRFDFKSSPFYICREQQSWDVAPDSLRRAAVSSFGYSGTNAHLVIEEYPVQQAPFKGDSSCIVPISARNAEQLRQKVEDLLEFIRAQQQSPDLAAVAYTLQVGREAMEERLGFVVNSLDELAAKLDAYLRGEKNIESAQQGRVEPGSEGIASLGRDDDMQGTIEKWIVQRKLSKLLQVWVKGLDFDWNGLYGDAQPVRVSLPAYPFARERYWIQPMISVENPETNVEVYVNMKSIEDIINKISDDMIETEQAVKELKVLV